MHTVDENTLLDENGKFTKQSTKSYIFKPCNVSQNYPNCQINIHTGNQIKIDKKRSYIKSQK